MIFISNVLQKIYRSIIFRLFVIVIGLFSVLLLPILLGYYEHISLNILYIAPIIFLLWIYFRDRKSIVSETLWKVESKYIFTSGIVLLILISFNYWRGVVTAPIILFICGIYGIAIAYMVGQDGKDSAAKNASDYSYKIKTLSSKLPHWVIKNLVILLIISGYWFIQIQKNEQATKDEGVEQALDLSNYEVYLNPPSNAVARIDSITRIVFTKVQATEEPGKVFQMCISFSIEESQNGVYFRSLPLSEELCFNREYPYSDWSQSMMRYKVENLVRKKLQ